MKSPTSKLEFQLNIFDQFEEAKRPVALWSVDEIWHRLSVPLLQSGLKEDNRLELKPARIQARQFADYLLMFANTKPSGGIVVVGIRKDTEFEGCKHISQDKINELEKAASIYAPDARCIHRRIEGKKQDGSSDFVLAFRVYYREDKVVKNTKGEAYIRRSDEMHKLTPDEIRQLEIDKGQVDFELEPAKQYSYPNDFNATLVKQFVSGFRKRRDVGPSLRTEEVLQLMKLGKLLNSEFIPNNALVLLCAKDPNLAFPGCMIRFLRFDGEEEYTGERYNVIKDEWIKGTIPEQIVKAEEVLESQLREFSRLGPDNLFVSMPEYPKAAWYEAVVNACVHRSYFLRNMNIFIKMFDNRLVVESPGPFPPLVTPQNIYDIHNPRNPRIVEAMFYLDFVRCAHEGARRIRDTMLESDLPAPKFVQDDRAANSQVSVVLKNNIRQRRVWIDRDVASIVGAALAETLSSDELRIINHVAEFDSITVSHAQRITGRGTWHQAKKKLEKLTSLGLLVRVSRYPRDPSSHYRLKRNGSNQARR